LLCYSFPGAPVTLVGGVLLWSLWQLIFSEVSEASAIFNRPDDASEASATFERPNVACEAQNVGQCARILLVHVPLCINACQVLCILSLSGKTLSAKHILCCYTWCFILCFCNRFQISVSHNQKLANIVRSAGACGFGKHGFDMIMPLFRALC